jgi:DnaJ-like protein
MPFRCIQSIATLPIRRSGALLRPLHTTRVLLRGDHDGGGLQRLNHYEALNLDPGAAPAEIKKFVSLRATLNTTSSRYDPCSPPNRAFYALSKTHHPDHNPSDPHAAHRFMRLSEAYTVLAHPSRRAAYDRDVLRLHQKSPAHRKGSFSSANPAGGRPASGLSRRRGAFHGPPPSFFRSGGWGSHGAKRGAAHDESTGGADRAPGAGAGATAGGMGPGQNPFHVWGEDLPHFDRRAHERTQRQILERLARRRRSADGAGADLGMAANYVVAAGLLIVAAVWQPWWGRGKRNSEAGDKKMLA